MLVAAAYVTWRLNWIDWHARAGYALLALVVFRLLWGFFGSETARFARFIASPRAAARHLAHMFRREPDHQVGHNPAGGWMVLVLLALLFGETLTGIYVNNDVADAGPLTGIGFRARRQLDHRTPRDLLAGAAGGDGAARPRDLRLLDSEASQSDAADDQRTQGVLVAVRPPALAAPINAVLFLGCGALLAAVLANFP